MRLIYGIYYVTFALQVKNKAPQNVAHGGNYVFEKY